MRFLVILLLGLCTLGSCKQKKTVYEVPAGRGIEKAEKAGIKLAVQSYSFKNISLIEAIEQTADLGLKYIEVYPGHAVGGVWGDKPFSDDLPDEVIDNVKEWAKRQGVQIVGYGVFKTTERADWEKLFAFAKKLNLSYITCEPEEDHLDLIEELSEKSNIKVSIHNSIESPAYSDPDMLKEKIANRSSQIGICGDLGNWKRSGYHVIEVLENTNNRLISVHLKDLCPSEFDDNILFDCLLNIGVIDIDEAILTLKNNDFKGYLAIEYITGETNPFTDLSQSVSYYNFITDRVFD